MAHTRIARLPIQPSDRHSRPRRTETEILDAVLAYLAQPQGSTHDPRPCMVRCECVATVQDPELWNELATALEDGRPHQCYASRSPQADPPTRSRWCILRTSTAWGSPAAERWNGWTAPTNEQLGPNPVVHTQHHPTCTGTGGVSMNTEDEALCSIPPDSAGGITHWFYCDGAPIIMMTTKNWQLIRRSIHTGQKALAPQGD